MSKFRFGAIAFAIAVSVFPAAHRVQAQVTSDVAEVYLAHSVTIGDRVLQSGNYKIEQLNIAGGDSPALRFLAADGTGPEIVAHVSPIVENRTQPATRVIFGRDGGHYYLDKIWVKGWTYGFQFTVPGKSKKTER